MNTNVQTDEIIGHLLTTKEIDATCQVAPLVDQLDEPVAAFVGDGAYNTQSGRRLWSLS